MKGFAQSRWWIGVVLLCVAGLGLQFGCRCDRAASPQPKGKSVTEKSINKTDTQKMLPVKKPLAKLFVNSLGMKMIRVPAGSFEMGESGRSEHTTPVHRVTLTSDFYMAKTEVTKGAFRQFIRETGFKKEVTELDPKHDPYLILRDKDGKNIGSIRRPEAARFTILQEEGLFRHAPGDDYPIFMIEWKTAVKFCEWLSKKEGCTYRLPTEAEWEYVCRAGTKTLCWWGDKIRSGMFVYNAIPCWQPFRKMSLPGSFPVNPWGFCDMLGNAGEWCSDWYDPNYYQKSPLKNPQGPQNENDDLGHVWRGGWSGAGMKSIYTAGRTCEIILYGAGIRLLCEIDDRLRAKQLPEPKIASLDQSSIPKVKKLPTQKVKLADGVMMEMVQLPAGDVLLGSPKTEKNRGNYFENFRTLVHHTHSFWISRYEVTQAQYQTIMKENPSTFLGKNHPVNGVLQEDAWLFCRRLTDREQAAGRLPKDEEYRLPVESEWEYACRAGSKTAYHFGNNVAQLRYYAWFDVLGGTRPVGQKLPNVWGLYDMYGNVAEWVCDYNWNYPGGEKNDYVGRGRGGYMSYIIRGGHWSVAADHRCRSAARSWNPSKARTNFIGFRVVRRKLIENNDDYKHYLRIDRKALETWHKVLQKDHPISKIKTTKGLLK